MQTLLQELTIAQRSLVDALAQLRDQQALVSLTRDAHDHRDIVVLLSNALRHFYKIEEHRNAILEGIGEFLPMRRSNRITELRRSVTPKGKRRSSGPSDYKHVLRGTLPCETF
jgi:hypothetical protein